MFEEFDFDFFMDRMLSNVSNNIDKREGSVIFDSLAPMAFEEVETYIVLDMILNEVFADSASYYYLIKRAAEKGLFPKEETYAIGKMVVEPADVTIVPGERFNLDTLNYQVVEPIEGEQGVYKIQCETAGVVGNQQLGMLLPIEYVEGLETAELTEILVPGEDEEDVEDFRQRYFASFTNQAFGGNKSDYKAKVKDIEGAGNAKIIRMWKNGYNPAEFIPTDAVKNWFTAQSSSTVGSEVYEWLKMVYTAALEKLLTVGGTVKIIFLTSDYKQPSSTLVQTVQQTIDPTNTTGEGDGVAPIGHVVNVVGAKNSTINFNFSITYKSGYSFADVKSNIETVIDDYFETLITSWAEDGNTVIRRNQVEALLLSIEGIINVNSTTINGKDADLTLDAEYIPTRGVING